MEYGGQVKKVTVSGIGPPRGRERVVPNPKLSKCRSRCNLLWRPPLAPDGPPPTPSFGLEHACPAGASASVRPKPSRADSSGRTTGSRFAKSEARRSKSELNPWQVRESARNLCAGGVWSLGAFGIRFSFGFRASDSRHLRLSRRVSPRCCSGGTTDALRCGSHVGSETPCVCRPFAAVSAFCVLPSDFSAHSLPTHHCCPVSGPVWARRGRLRRLAPAAMQASCCSSVRAWLYFREAALRRARQCSWLGVRGSRGFLNRCRCCLPRNK
jgi:hypothetical protein